MAFDMSTDLLEQARAAIALWREAIAALHLVSDTRNPIIPALVRIRDAARAETIRLAAQFPNEDAT